MVFVDGFLVVVFGIGALDMDILAMSFAGGFLMLLAC